jgi:hypothetical protein
MKFRFSGLMSKKNAAPAGFVPKQAPYQNSDDIGWLGSEFVPFEHNEDAFPARDPVIQELKNAPPPGPMDMVIKRLMESAWKSAEPVNAQRGPVMMGARGGLSTGFTPAPTYRPQVRPTAGGGYTTLGNDDPIASDWKLFQDIKRKNAVTFRGDSRSPHQVIVKCGGFYPPNTRTDRDYLKDTVYPAFNSYLSRRYKVQIKENDFFRIVDQNLMTGEDKQLFIDYMMWRQITEREAGHLGRMVDNECLKGYVSTTPKYGTAFSFAQKKTGQGWIYITKVYGGFVIPEDKTTLWGSEEMEIAQYGPIPADRIVGFVRVGQGDLFGEKFPKLEGPIYFRPSFRAEEPEAFNYLFNELSAKIMFR